MRENKTLHATFKSIEQVRAKMYQEAIENAIEQGLMRESEYPNEYKLLIERIRIFSDFWISSAEIYSQEQPEAIISHHANLLMNMFYPYLTEVGKQVVLDYQSNFFE
jgi:hypothetical protein